MRTRWLLWRCAGCDMSLSIDYYRWRNDNTTNESIWKVWIITYLGYVSWGFLYKPKHQECLPQPLASAGKRYVVACRPALKSYVSEIFNVKVNIFTTLFLINHQLIFLSKGISSCSECWFYKKNLTTYIIFKLLGCVSNFIIHEFTK